MTRALMIAVRLYRALPRSRPPTCRFEPTCSQYALDALRAWGALRGSWLAMCRVCRCRPWGGWGYDPVPTSSVEGRERRRSATGAARLEH
ncbi:membrane protein insertion efficiency factor YidD [Candidatus Poriferisodalis sp.]|uniref:membrane protein insertion efficiency factor YidD n=1 Tax=Candidatus Poriferisodalis sp. TaxID=3101277 RepID=UPI003B02C47F